MIDFDDEGSKELIRGIARSFTLLAVSAGLYLVHVQSIHYMEVHTFLYLMILSL